MRGLCLPGGSGVSFVVEAGLRGEGMMGVICLGCWGFVPDGVCYRSFEQGGDGRSCGSGLIGGRG